MKYQLLFGDVHNHNTIGYGQGTFEHSLEFARNNRLDFWALTPHSHYPDIPPTVLPELQAKYVAAWEHVRSVWPEIQRKVCGANVPGDFTVFLGYERHSAWEGDHHLIYPNDDGPLVCADTIAEFQSHARTHNALLIPHHLLYAPGMCGVNWEALDPEVSPVVEIYSEHGGSERDRGPFPGLRHSSGGRCTKMTVQHALVQGHRFGFVAGTDDHWGCPGAYDEGLTAVWASDNTREAIFDAVRARRTYALTGDRIRLEFELNKAPMGSVLSGVEGKSVLRVAVEGWDEIDRIEVIKNNHVVHRVHPVDRAQDRQIDKWPNRLKVFIQYGWGQYGEWVETRTYEWLMHIALSGGEIRNCIPCFRHGPFVASPLDNLTKASPNVYHVVGVTGRSDVLNDDATKGIWLDISGSPEARLRIETTSPGRSLMEESLGNLSQHNCIAFTGKPPAPSILVHRLVEPLAFSADFEWADDTSSRADLDWYYVRVTQSNGQTAWSSPIWVES